MASTPADGRPKLRGITGGAGGPSAPAATATAIAKPIQAPVRVDETEFHAGKRGRSNAEMVALGFKIHEGYAAEVEKWMRSGKVPQYVYQSDLLRHAVVRHLRHYLPSIAGELEGSLMAQMAQIDEVTARWEFENAFVKQIDWIAEQVNKTLQMPGGRREVSRMLRIFKRHIDVSKPGFFKGVYQKMFNDRFGPYMVRAALVDYDESEEARAAEANGGGGGDGSDLLERWGMALVEMTQEHSDDGDDSDE